MTGLRDLLLARIAATGPLTIADYMAECLLHPRFGYYASRDPFGAAGDFTTAPEISQMFGELLGLCLAQAWLDQGAPAPFALAEIGPGRGTLMADMLRATRKVPGFHQAAQVHLVEASARLRLAQQAALPVTAVWHDKAADLPALPLFVVANEFFDALPIRQFVRHDAGWRERVVGAEADRLIFGLTDAAPLASLEARRANTTEGDLVEICPAAPAVVHAIAARIAAAGGTALIWDYGGWTSRGDTLQAVRAHRFADPLADPGRADLTAHVDFAALAQAAVGVARSALLPQGQVLRRLGIDQRAEVLARGLTGAALDSHRAAHRRLTDPAKMGTLFRTLALFPADAPPPPGYLDA